MYGLPPITGFVSSEENIDVNGCLTNQHPINNKNLVCHIGTSYTHFCSQEDFRLFDHKRFIRDRERKGYKSILKTKNVFVYQLGDGRLAALKPETT